jgi:hypothetical protein
LHPRGQQISNAFANRGGVKDAAIEQHCRRRQDCSRRGARADQASERFTGFDIGEASHEEASEVLADRGIRCVGQTEFPQAHIARFLGQIRKLAQREKAIENDALQSRPVERCRQRSGEETGAA